MRVRSGMSGLKLVKYMERLIMYIMCHFCAGRLLHELAQDVAIAVMNKLNAPERARLAMVSKTWRELSLKGWESVTWTRILPEEDPHDPHEEPPEWPSISAWYAHLVANSGNTLHELKTYLGSCGLSGSYPSYGFSTCTQFILSLARCKTFSFFNISKRYKHCCYCSMQSRHARGIECCNLSTALEACGMSFPSMVCMVGCHITIDEMH